MKHVFSQSTDDVLANLEVNRSGLTNKEVLQRRDQYGENKQLIQ